jgi:hypothetical protein
LQERARKLQKATCDRLSNCWKEHVQEQKLVVLLSKSMLMILKA